MRSTLPLGLLVASTLALAGCAGPLACLETVSSVSWTEAGIYDRAPTTNRAGYEVQPFDMREAGEGPIRSPTLDREWRGDYRFLLAKRLAPWEGEGWRGGHALNYTEFRDPETVWGVFDRSVPVEDARAAFASFAGNVTCADAAQIERWADAFADSRHFYTEDAAEAERYRAPQLFRVRIGEPDCMSPLFERLLAEDRIAPVGHPTSRAFEGEGWHFPVAVGAKTARKTTDGADLTITAYADDHVDARYYPDRPVIEASDARVDREIRRAFADLGLGEAHLDGATRSTSNVGC